MALKFLLLSFSFATCCTNKQYLQKQAFEIQISNPSMETPRIHTQFTVKSGHLCYGELHNIWHGASVEPVNGLTNAMPQSSGTVIIHNLDYNVPAQNGTWNAYQLLDTTDEHLVGWFVAHESVDVPQELNKILRVSGSPYELDSGNRFNNEETAAEGVLVINRYDWGEYDERALSEVQERGQNEESDPSTYVFGISVGLVDYAEAKPEVRFWKDIPEDRRGEERRPHGLWLHVPKCEYRFGRFGFNDEHNAARSFLLFSTYTVFTQTTIAGMQQPLRKYESPEERYQRQLREGFDFRGLEMLDLFLLDVKPAEEDLLGPYAEKERLFLEADVRAVLQQKANSLDFVDPWRARVELLLNELLMSYLERYIMPQGGSFDTVLAAAEALTPQQTKDSTLNSLLFKFLTQPHANPIPDLDATAVANRIRAFLLSRSREERSLFDSDEYVAGLCRCLAFLLGEILEIANFASKDGGRFNIMPIDIRIAVRNNDGLFSAFKFSRVFFDGSE